jgi:hypothetical protein
VITHFDEFSSPNIGPVICIRVVTRDGVLVEGRIVTSIEESRFRNDPSEIELLKISRKCQEMADEIGSGRYKTTAQSIRYDDEEPSRG